MATWHARHCAPKVTIEGLLPYCRECSSLFDPDNWKPNGDGLSSLPPIPPARPRSDLNFVWPSPTLFSDTLLLQDGGEDISPAIIQYLTDDSESHDISAGLENDLAKAKTSTTTEPYLDSMEDSIYRKCPVVEPGVIRLLTLSQGAGDVPLHGYLRSSNLDSDHPDFEALSYTWADLDERRIRSGIIYLGDEWLPLSLTANCEAALRRLRDSERQRILWIDAICINQGSSEERSHQVQMMQSIYKAASEVLVFLGQSDETSRLALDTIARLHDKDVETLLSKSGNPQIRNDMLRSVQETFKRPYFSRLWILQEILAARSISVLCGTNWVPFRCFQDEWLRGTEILPLAPMWLLKLVPRRETLAVADFFEVLIVTIANCKCGDPRDRVFALLGFLGGAQDDHLIPNYSLPVEEVYLGVAAYLLQRNPGLLGPLVNLAIDQRVAGQFACPSLPSWVPQLHVGLQDPERYLRYASSRAVAPDAGITVHGRTGVLTLSGIHLKQGFDLGNLDLQNWKPEVFCPGDSFLFIPWHAATDRVGYLFLHLRPSNTDFLFRLVGAGGIPTLQGLEGPQTISQLIVSMKARPALSFLRMWATIGRRHGYLNGGSNESNLLPTESDIQDIQDGRPYAADWLHPKLPSPSDRLHRKVERIIQQLSAAMTLVREKDLVFAEETFGMQFPRLFRAYENSWKSVPYSSARIYSRWVEQELVRDSLFVAEADTSLAGEFSSAIKSLEQTGGGDIALDLMTLKLLQNSVIELSQLVSTCGLHQIFVPQATELVSNLEASGFVRQKLVLESFRHWSIGEEGNCSRGVILALARLLHEWESWLNGSPTYCEHGGFGWAELVDLLDSAWESIRSPATYAAWDRVAIY